MKYIIAYLRKAGFSKVLATNIANGLLIVGIILLCLISVLISRAIINRIVSRLGKKRRNHWIVIMQEHKIFHLLPHFLPPFIISMFAEYFPKYIKWIERGVVSYVIIVVMIIVDAFLNSIDSIYRRHEVSKTKPIKGLLQALKILIFLVGFVMIIAELIGQSPLILLSGIGAVTAVFTLVFKDSILGFIAGIELASNDMVRIGDWIEMSKYDADGSVIEISLNTVKVENFDKTITTIPAYALISDSFKNWRGMEKSGGRRIKRAIYIDVSSITFCTDEMLDKFKKIEFISEYIEDKKNEVDLFNKYNSVNLEEKTNGRRLTNIGTFRIYIQNYIKNHPDIHKDMELMVRQLPYNGRGLPIEIYAFTNTTKWEAYESIQADIFDHIISVVPQFELCLFQDPSGYDFKNLK